jgi:hypothetical protein
MRAGTKGKPRHPGRVRGGVPGPRCYLAVEASGTVSGFDEKSNAQCEQPNRAESDSQHCERYGIVVQPVHLLLHGTPPCQILSETAPTQRLRRASRSRKSASHSVFW